MAKHKGAFVEVHGDTLANRVLEYLLENQDIDIAVGDLAEEISISRPKAYEIIAQFEKKKYVIKSRVVGRTQLYKINKSNRRIRLFMRMFLECLRIIAEEYAERKEKRTKSARIALASAKRK